jgi:uncharacterized protein (DUF885 family)
MLLLRNDIEDEKFTPWLMPVTQMSGYHLFAAQFPALLSFASTKDYDDYLTRLHNLPKQFEQTEAHAEGDGASADAAEVPPRQGRGPGGADRRR